jgi:integrase
MASIKRRQSGYQAQVRRKGFPQVSKMFSSLKDAEAWSRQIESEMDRGVFQDRTEADRNTLGDIFQRYMQEVSPLKKSGVAEANRIRRFLRDDPICKYKATALSGKLLSEWRDKRLLEVSGSTVNRELNLISHAINIARKEWGIHISNPVELIRRPKENKGRERRLSPEEEFRLLASLDESGRDSDGQFKTGTRNIWLKPVMLFAIETAMRRGEILSLLWINIDSTPAYNHKHYEI